MNQIAAVKHTPHADVALTITTPTANRHRAYMASSTPSSPRSLLPNSALKRARERSATDSDDGEPCAKRAQQTPPVADADVGHDASLVKKWGLYARSNATLRECHFLRLDRKAAVLAGFNKLCVDELDVDG